MKFYFYPDNGKPRRMKMSEVRGHLSEPQFEDAKDTKRKAPARK